MLQSIRDNLTGPIVWVVVGLITIPFAIWGVESFFTGGGDPTVAKVGGTKITQSQFRAAYENSYRRLQQLYGESFKADLIDPVKLRSNVLDNMVDDTVLRQSAREDGYRASDATIRESITQIPAFQENGQFSRAAYDRMLALRGMNSERFVSQLRDSLSIDQMRDAVQGTAFITAAESTAAAKLALQQREFAYIKLDPASYLAAATVSDEQIKARYEEKKASYQAPERIKLAYLDLVAADLPKATPPGKEVLQTIYDAEKASRFTTVEQRKASHILISAGADKAAAKNKASDLYQQLKRGADFGALAKANSADTDSAKDGGKLGLVPRGTRNPDFEKALYGLSKAGDVTEPTDTPFGWEIIRLDELLPPRTAAFDEPVVQQQLVDLYQQRDAERRFNELSKKLEDTAFENPSSLEASAKATELKVQTTDWFTRAGGSGVTANAAVIAAAFSPELVKDNENSKPITIEPGHIVIVRKAEYEAPRQRELGEVTDAIREELRKEQANAKARSEADAIVAELNAGKSLEEVAKSHGATVVPTASVQHSAADLDRSLLDALFKLPRPAAGKHSVGEATLAQGVVAVISLASVKDGGASDAAAARDAAALRDTTAGAEYGAYRADLKSRIKVDVRDKLVAESAANP